MLYARFVTKPSSCRQGTGTPENLLLELERRGLGSSFHSPKQARREISALRSTHENSRPTSKVVGMHQYGTPICCVMLHRRSKPRLWRLSWSHIKFRTLNAMARERSVSNF